MPVSPQTAQVVHASEAERTLLLEHVFKAPPREVFQAWTDPSILTRWWGPVDLPRKSGEVPMMQEDLHATAETLYEGV